MQRPVSLRPLSFPLTRSLPVSLLLLGFFVSPAQAQPPTATAFVSGPMSPDATGGLWVTVAVGADAPGDATVTVDPLGVGRNTFVRRLVKIAYSGHGLDPCPSNRQCFSDDFTLDSRLPPGQYQVPVTVTDSKGRQTKVVVPFQTTAGSDTDHDGLPDAWEEEYGLSPYSALGDDGPAGDPDADGVSNLDEYKAGTNPRDKYVRFFAEGSSGASQPLNACVYVMPLQVSDNAYAYLPVHVTYIGDNGRHAVSNAKISNWGGGFCPMGGVSTNTVADRVVEIRVESTVALAVERDIDSGITHGEFVPRTTCQRQPRRPGALAHLDVCRWPHGRRHGHVPAALQPDERARQRRCRLRARAVIRDRAYIPRPATWRSHYDLGESGSTRRAWP